MRLRVYTSSLRLRSKTVATRKQKMDTGRRGKRKSPSQSIIFEVSDNDISSEDECKEPEAKISKLDNNSFAANVNEVSNLENAGEEITVEISSHEDTNAVEISEHISVSNSSAANSSGSGSDVIVISEDIIDVVNDTEEYYIAPRAESIENSEHSADDAEIIDITDDKPVFLPEQNSDSVPDVNLFTNSDENPICLTDDNTEPSKDVKDENLEDGELEDIQIEVQVEEETDVSECVDVEVPQDEVDTKPAPCICITFSDDKIAQLYKFKFLKFLQEFVELEVENSEGLTLAVKKDDTLNMNEWVVLDESMCHSITDDTVDTAEKVEPVVIITPEKAAPKKKKKKKNKKVKELFILDTNPSENEDGLQFMKYSTKFQIDTSEKASPAESEVMRASTQTCFNCDSNHAIKDCPLPKDFGRINAARQRFKSQKQTARYHLEEDQKYSHLAPGKISDRLREALGLRSNQAPPFIYHMRILGYPPGWLEEAKFVHSNLSMFDTEGNDVRHTSRLSLGLDPEKVIDYPGFNVPFEKNVKDESRQYQVPPFSETFSKQAMIEYFEKHCAKEQDDFETCDMDLDDGKEKMPTLAVTQEAVAANPLLSVLKDMDSNLPSPSLPDLEKVKETLLAALEDSSSNNPKSVEADCEDAGNVSDQDKLKNSQETPQTEALDKTLHINIEKAENSSSSFASPSLNSSKNCVKTSSFGTPILTSSSPYSRLPDPDNFMKDVSPVINFENLPNATGKYEQMTGVLQKVRNVLKKQNCK